MHPKRSSNMVFLSFLTVVILVALLRGSLLLQERTSLLDQAEADLLRKAELHNTLDAERLNNIRTWLHLAARSHDSTLDEPQSLPPDIMALLPSGVHVDGVLTADATSADRWLLEATPTDTRLGIDDSADVLILQQPLDDGHMFQVSIPAMDFARDSLPRSRLRTWLVDQEGLVTHHPEQEPEPPPADSAGWLRAEQPVAGIGLQRIIATSKATVLKTWWTAAYLYWLSIAIVLIILATGLVIDRRSHAAQQVTQQRYQARLLKLVHASSQISRGRSIAGVFERTTRLARELIPAHQAVASSSHGDSGRQEIHAVALSDHYAKWRDYDDQPTGEGIYTLAVQQRRTIRLTQAEIEAHPAFRRFGHAAEQHPPLQGWLAAPVLASDGRMLGLLQLSHRYEGEFDSEDEAILQQLAMVAAAAIEQTQALEALHANRAAAERARDEYARLLESLGEVYIAVDANGHIAHLNPAAAELYCVDPEAMRGRPLAELDAAATQPPAATHFAQVMRDRELLRFTWHHEHLNRTFEVHGFPTPTGFGALLTDVTERRAIEEQLRQAQKMEIVGQLTGGVAHDFNNLLTVILGQIDLLTHDEDGSLAEDDVRDGLNMIAEASQRAAQLTQRLLAFARRQTLNPTLVNPGRVLKQIELLLRRTIGANVEIELVHSAGLWDVEIDVNQFENAILNLALNARDAMTEGGRLSIEATNVRIDEHYANADAEPGQYVMVAVTDSGRGMSPEVAARAFEPFFTTKEVGAGTGLGLSMVYGFLRQSGGQAKIYSEPGEGTMVRLYLPRRFNPDEQDDALSVINNTPLPKGNERILLVEDDDLVRAFVSHSLDQLGYRVMPVANGPAAIHLLEAGKRFDLLLTDVVLPGGMSGRQVADAVGRLQPDIRILYASGYSDNAIVHHGRLDHGVEFLGKPFSQTELATKVRRMLDASN